MTTAEPDDPQDAVVANQLKQNQEMCKQTASLWTYMYAGKQFSSTGYTHTYTQKIKIKTKLCTVEFDRNAVIVALSSKLCYIGTVTNCFWVTETEKCYYPHLLFLMSTNICYSQDST